MVMIDDWLEADDSRYVHLVKDALILNKHSRSQDKLNWGVKVLFAKNYPIACVRKFIKVVRRSWRKAGFPVHRPTAGLQSVKKAERHMFMCPKRYGW